MKTVANSLQRVLVVDDHLLVRAGVTALLQDMPGFECVGSAADAASGLRACLQLRPDLARPRDGYLAEIGTRLAREIPAEAHAFFPVNAVLADGSTDPRDTPAAPFG